MVYYAIATSVKLCVSNLGKMIYLQPRPFWTDSTIQMFELECQEDYGNPSGHSLSAVGLSLIVGLDVIQSVIMTSNHNNTKKIVFSFGIMTMVLFYSITNGYSRIVMRAHSWN